MFLLLTVTKNHRNYSSLLSKWCNHLNQNVIQCINHTTLVKMSAVKEHMEINMALS